jgi:hypothetical protein
MKSEPKNEQAPLMLKNRRHPAENLRGERKPLSGCPREKAFGEQHDR